MRWAVLQKWFSSCVGAEGVIFIAIAGHQTSPTCLAWLNSGAFGISFWQVGFCKEWCINCQEERKWARVAKFGTWNISFVIWWRQLLMCRAVGTGRGYAPPPLEIFSDRLTLSQPWGEGERIIQDYTSPLDFRPSYGHVLLLHTLTVWTSTTLHCTVYNTYLSRV